MKKSVIYILMIMITIFLGTVMVSAESINIINIQNGVTYVSVDSIQINTTGYGYLTYSLYKDGTEVFTDIAYGLEEIDNLTIEVPTENGAYQFNIYNSDTMTIIKSVSYEIDSNYIPSNEGYQVWSGYPSSPVLSSDYPYQYIYKQVYSTYVFTRLVTSQHPFLVSEEGTLSSYYLGTSSFRLYEFNGSVWVLGNENASSNYYVTESYEANNDVYADFEQTTVYFAKNTTDGNQEPDQAITYNYYIHDVAQLFTTQQKIELMELEKKLEQNCKMQFFIKTHTEPYAAGTEINTIFNYANQKAPTGNGAYVIDIYKDTANNKVYITVGTTEIMAIQIPAIGIINNIKRYIKYYNDFTYSNIASIIDKTYWDLILNNTSRDLFVYSDGIVSTYRLFLNRLTPKGYIQDETFIGDIRTIIISQYVPSVQPSIIPTEPTPTPSGSPVPTSSPEPYIPGIDINPGDFNLSGKTPLAPLKGALERLKQLKQSETAPVFKINLRSLINASTSRLSPGAGDALPNEETSYLDFGQLSVIQFGGYSLIHYFRTLIGALMVWFTILYIWKGIVPDSTIGG